MIVDRSHVKRTSHVQISVHAKPRMEINRKFLCSKPLVCKCGDCCWYITHAKNLDSAHGTHVILIYDCAHILWGHRSFWPNLSIVNRDIADILSVGRIYLAGTHSEGTMC